MSPADHRPSQPQPRSASGSSSHASVSANEARRRQKHGRVRPMREPTLIERLLGR